MSTNKINNLLSLVGKTAIITGGASGIGLGAAKRLAEAGADIAIFDIQTEKGRKAEKEITELGVKARFVECDVRSDESCRNAVEVVMAEFGHIDILSNNAGVAIRKNSVDLAEAEWDLALDVGLKGMYLVSHYVLPHMITGGGGSIINTGSGWSLKGGPDAVSYCAVKGGVLNLTRAMAIDHGPHNIRVNCVCPGDVDTPLLRSECAQLGEDETEFMEDAADRPMNRVGTPEDIANAVLFLPAICPPGLPVPTW